MHAAKRSQKRAERHACPFTTVAVNLAHAIAIVITCPLVLSVIDGCMLRRDPVVAPLLVRIDDRPIRRNRFGQDALIGRLVALSDQWATFFARLTADAMDDRRTVVLIGTMPRLLIRATARRIVRVASWRRVCTVCRESCSSRARRAVDSPLLMPRSRRTNTAWHFRLPSKVVPLKSVE